MASSIYKEAFATVMGYHKSGKRGCQSTSAEGSDVVHTNWQL